MVSLGVFTKESSIDSHPGSLRDSPHDHDRGRDLEHSFLEHWYVLV